MTVLQINKFLYPRGGDAISMLATGDLLASHGHQVFYWGMEHPNNPPFPHSDTFLPWIDYTHPGGHLAKLRLAAGILHSREAARRLSLLLDRERPDIVHLHNIAHQLSPSIIGVLKDHGIPCVMTMHDYKMVCGSYLLLAKGKPCTRCRGGKHYHCLLSRCAKGGALGSALTTIEMYLHHHLLGSYTHVSSFICPSVFMERISRNMGFDRKLVYLPNFVAMPTVSPSPHDTDDAIAYVGRLSFEKGIASLVDAMDGMDTELRIFGDGPMRGPLERQAASTRASVRFMGYHAGERLWDEVSRCRMVVTPSEWYENLSRVLIEAFAHGIPIVASRIGGNTELVRDGETGYTFTPGDSANLRAAIRRLLDDPEGARRMGANGRALVEREYSPEGHYPKLMAIYEEAIAEQHR